MNVKVVKIIVLGVLIYGVVVAALIFNNPDDTSSMGWEDRQDFNKVQISKLELGKTRESILLLLGPPDLSEAKKIEQNRLQVMFYRTHHKKKDGITTQDECTPLLFENDILIAWGDMAYKDYLKN